ncbi:MAG: TRAP transporter small permease subunit [Rhizobiales bacterium]|nr:TRAP transporter small permease subunit [Hyphomicrobiales bacterium]
MAAYTRVVSLLSRICGIFAMLLLAAAVLVVCHMIFVRYVLGWSTVWQTEFVVYAIVASTFLGSPYVLIHRGHVNIDLLPNAAGPRGRFAMELAAGLVSLSFAALLAWSGWHYFYEALSEGWTTESVWALPLWIPLLPLPLGMGLLCLQYVAELWLLHRAGHDPALVPGAAIEVGD